MLEICKLVLFFFIGLYTFRWMKINECSQVLKFIFWLVFLRFVLAAFHDYTYLQVLGPLSIISVYSILLVFISIVFMYLKNIPIMFTHRFYLIKTLIFLMFVSALINSNLIQSVDSIFRWMFLLQLSTMLIESIKYNGIAKVLRVISMAYLYPVILVILSIVLGVSKATEIDGSISYVGGYYHEAVISVLILGAMSIFILMATEQGEKFKKLYFLPFFWFLLVMINYRTTLLASLFLGFFVLYAVYKNTQIISNKIIMALLVIMVMLGTTIFAPSSLFERFQEIPDAISQYSHFLTLPEYYSEEDQDFFSGRIYIWSTYISDALDGTDLQLLFGQGMNAWKERFSVYAHNTFVSFFYELGILGLGIFSLLIVNGYLRILKIKKSEISLPLCGVYTAFFVLNLGTMPLWQVEGIILFSLIIATTEYYVHRGHNELKKPIIGGVYTTG